jgi:hypothetical protein
MADVTSQPGGDGTSKDSGPRQSTDRTAKGFEPTQQEQDVVKGWRERIERAKTNPAYKDWVENLKLWREYVTGTAHKDKTGQKLTRTNMIFATIAASIPEIYAKNPDIAVTPTDAVPEAKMSNVKKFAATGERVLNKMLVVEGRLKKRSKANIRATSVASYGVLKMVYQSERRGDPLIIHRIEDSQDNLDKLEALLEKKNDEDDPVKLAKQRDEEKANLEALKAHKEVRMFKGFAVDRLKSEDFLILDDNIVEFDEYVEARALDQRTWMTVDHAKNIFRMEMTGASKYGRPRTDQASVTPGSENTTAGEMYVCVHEIWDKENGVVRTWVEGMNRWAREPYVPKNVSQRWYPFFVLGFNVVEGRWRPISDVELLAGLQDEYNTTRTNYADVREKAVPKRIIRKGGNLSEVDVKNVMDSGNKDWVAVEGNPATPISQDVMDLPGAKIDPQAYDVTVIRNDMDLVVGRSDASRANLIKPKTATEAEIMQEAMSTRTAERRDTNEDLMSDMATAALEIALGDLSKAEVQEIAGEDCEWPDAPESVEDIYRQVVVRVRAGSTGKPNQAQERDSWGKLLPQINETMQKVGELRQQGMYDQADALIELLKETLRRFDEHLDLDAIIPPVKKDEKGQPIAQAQAAAELVQVKQQLAECQQALEQCQEQLQQAKAQEQAKVAQIEADKQAKVAQAGVDTIRENEIAAREKEKAEHERSFTRDKALLDAAVKVVTSQLTAVIAANAKDPEAQEREAKVALSEERMGEVLKELTTTMDRLGSAFDRFKPQQQGAGA